MSYIRTTQLEACAIDRLDVIFSQTTRKMLARSLLRSTALRATGASPVTSAAAANGLSQVARFSSANDVRLLHSLALLCGYLCLMELLEYAVRNA